MVSNGPIGALFYPTSDLQYNFPVVNWPGALWKRTPATGTPPGARVVLGDLRPTCRPKSGAGSSASTPGSTFPLGLTTLTCAATDAFGNSAMQDMTITVQDTTPPVVTVPPSVTATAASGSTTATVTFTAIATDLVDGTLTPVCNHVSGSVFPIGATPVTCSATDGHGNTGSATFTVFVVQGGSSTVPALALPGTQTVEATSSAGATVTYAVTATDANGAALTPQCMPASGSTFAMGSHAVSCAATGATLTVTGSFQVTVQDTTPPAITLPADFSLDPGGTAHATLTYAAAATDAVDGAIACGAGTGAAPPAGSPACWCSPASGSVLAAGTTNEVGCVAVDSRGNRAVKTFKVTVKGLPPTLALTDMLKVEAQDSLGARVTYSPAPKATDASGNALPVDCVPPSGTYLPIDTDTKVWCSATDARGMESSGSFTVRVVDTTPPSVSVSAPGTVEATGPSGAPIVFTASAQDLVDGVVPVGCLLNPGTGSSLPVAASPSTPTFPLGVDPVTCTATDKRGNTGSKSFTVVVRDTKPPTLALPAPITATADGTGAAVVTFNATAMDTVAGAVPVACHPASGSRFFATGTTPATSVVSCSARDGAGNEAQGTFTVTVNPAPNPVKATCLGTAGAPVVAGTAPGTCGAAVGPGLVGTCSGGAAGLASCTVDGVATETLGPGDHPVALVATGLDGTKASCTAYVRVIDGQNPTATCANQTVACTGNAGATVTPMATCTDNCSCTASCATATFPVGTSPGNCTATDPTGNSASCRPSITVVDAVAPVVTPKAGPTQVQCNVDKWTDPGATALDQCVGDLSSKVSISGAVDPTHAGTYVETYTASDPSGNKGSATRTVQVLDTVAPTTTATEGPNGAPNRLVTLAVTSYTITPTGGGTPIMGSATCWSTAGVAVTLSATDSCAFKQLTYSLTGAQTGGATVTGGTASFAVTKSGTTTVSYFATDKAGNVEATKQLPVHVLSLLGFGISCAPAATIKGLPAHGAVAVKGTITVADAKTGKTTSQSFSISFSY